MYRVSERLTLKLGSFRERKQRGETEDGPRFFNQILFFYRKSYTGNTIEMWTIEIRVTLDFLFAKIIIELCVHKAKVSRWLKSQS